MKPQRFEIGQAVTPNKAGKWNEIGKPSQSPDPKFGEIYYITNYVEFAQGRWWINLKGWPNKDTFDELSFDPVMTDDQLSELMEESLKEQTQTI